MNVLPIEKNFFRVKNRKLFLSFTKLMINPKCTKIMSHLSKFNIFGSDGQIIVRRRKNKELNPKNLVYTSYDWLLLIVYDSIADSDNSFMMEECMSTDTKNLVKSILICLNAVVGAKGYSTK